MNKYIWGSLILVVISLTGIWWIMGKNGLIKTTEDKRKESINAIYPTVTITKGQPTVKKANPTTMVVGQAGTKGGLTEESSSQTVFKSVYDTDRKLYIEKEYSGTRYVLWRADSKITVHTGNSWSWVHPRRELDEEEIISGQKVFIYNIGSQKIVDFAVGSKKYTIQCVHNGVGKFKEECDEFLSNFKLI